jgi:hypothetical protein
MPTVIEARRHYEEFTADIEQLCRNDPAARRALRQGRGRPVEQCAPMTRYLARRTAGHGSRRAHYTVAGLIAVIDPLEEVRASLRPPQADQPDRPAGAADEPAATDTARPGAPAAPPAAGKDPAAPAAGEDQDERWSTRAWRARPNLGTTLAHAVNRAGFHAEHTGDLLHVLLKVGDDQMQRRLPSTVTRLLQAGLTPHWPVLLDDLIEYRFQAARVALRWQDGFYLTTPDKDQP